MKIKKFPLVSIIVNCFNGEEYLEDCLRSVLKQSYKNWELIFWDNISTDQSKKILKQFKDKRIKYFKSKKFTSLYKARNLAISKAKGDYVGFLDTDEIWKRNKLSEQIKILKKNKNINIIYSNYIYNNQIKGKKFLKFKDKLPSGLITQKLLNDYKIGILTCLVQRKLLYKLKFNSSYEIIGDFDFFIRASCFNKIVAIQKPLAEYRAHQNNLSIKKIKVYCNEISEWIEKMSNNKNFKKNNFYYIKKYLVKLKIKYIVFKYLNVNLGV